MSRAMNFWVMGGDQRQAALAGLLEEDGHTVHTFALEGAEGLTCEASPTEAVRADCVVLPLPAAGERGELNAPLSRESCALDWVLDFLRPGQLVCAGMVKPELAAMAQRRGLILRDYFAREELAVANAVPTALAVGHRLAGAKFNRCAPEIGMMQFYIIAHNTTAISIDWFCGLAGTVKRRCGRG